jgi:hypothetical protein
MSDSNKEIKRSDILIRGLYMLFFFAAGRISLTLIYILSFIQFILQFTFKETNPRILKFTKPLSQYLHQIADFLTYKTETKPWPFSEWPKK